MVFSHNSKKVFKFLIVFAFISHASAVKSNIFSSLYNFVFTTGIILKTDKAEKNLTAFQQERKYDFLKSLFADRVSKRVENLTEVVTSLFQKNLSSSDKNSSTTVQDELGTISPENKTITEYRFPFYKKTHTLNVGYEYNGLGVSVIAKLNHYKTTHHFIPGDGLILGAVALTGYLAYKFFKKS